MQATNERTAVLYILQNKQAFAGQRFAYAMSNKRPLQRLSTKQLQAKLVAWNNVYDRAAVRYAASLPAMQPAFGGVTL